MTTTDRQAPTETVDLRAWGWSMHWSELSESRLEPGLLPGRVVMEKRGLYRLIAEHGEVVAGTTGRIRHHSEGAADLPAVGDWVLFQPASAGQKRALISVVLPRLSRLSRKVAGQRADEQVVASNLDTVFVVMGLDGDFNMRRLERFLVVAWASGAQPVVLLNKKDLSRDPEARRSEVVAIAAGAPVLLVSCKEQEGLGEVAEHLQEARTAVLLGSSGVGKSTLVNRLHGEGAGDGEGTLVTGKVREGDDRGRHTTTHRQLFRLPGGALLLDNPGVREIQPWQAEEGLRAAFEDLYQLAEVCRFRDCKHQDEPGCAVQAAVQDGELDRARLGSFHSLSEQQRELERRNVFKPRRRGRRPSTTDKSHQRNRTR